MVHCVVCHSEPGVEAEPSDGSVTLRSSALWSALVCLTCRKFEGIGYERCSIAVDVMPFKHGLIKGHVS